MSKTKSTPGPWHVGAQNDALYIIDQLPRPNNDYPQHDAEVAAIAKVYHSGIPGTEEANAHLIAAAPDLYEAEALLEQAEDAWANCEECGGEGVPELCELCFPLFDDARIKRRLALAKARGEQS